MKKLRYKRIMMVMVVLSLFVITGSYLLINRNHYHEYQGKIETLTCTYRNDYKIYTFSLHTFETGGKRYVSLNDMYNMILILDPQTHVYIHQSKHLMVFEMKNETYSFHFGKDLIMMDAKTIDVSDEGAHLYMNGKHIYLDTEHVEQVFFDNKKSIKITDEKAIIE